MPFFQSTYPYEIHNHTLGKTVAVGEVVEASENPDGNFFIEVTPDDGKPKKNAAATEPKE